MRSGTGTAMSDDRTAEPLGLSELELLAMYDRCQAYPTIRAAIPDVLQPDRAGSSDPDRVRRSETTVPTELE